MLCPKPIGLALGFKVPCGRCIACRINRRRAWVARFYLESLSHVGSSFVTLTYDDAHMPVEDGRGVLVKEDVQLFMKRMRHEVSFRHVAVGEYGDKYWRPHYHLLMFGVPATPEYEELIQRKWGQGFISISEAIRVRMAYIAGYTVKKMTKKWDDRLDGRPPEFALYSQKPALGVVAAKQIAQGLKAGPGWSMAMVHTWIRDGDIPRSIRFQGKTYPLDRYICNVIRSELGIPHLARDRRSGEEVKEPITEEVLEQAKKVADRAELVESRIRKRSPF